MYLRPKRPSISFLLGGVGLSEKDLGKPAGADWLTAKAWGELCRSHTLSPAFSMLPDEVVLRPFEWQPIFDAVGRLVDIGQALDGGLQ